MCWRRHPLRRMGEVGLAAGEFLSGRHGTFGKLVTGNVIRIEIAPDLRLPDEISVKAGKQDENQSDRALDDPVAALIPAMGGHEGPQKPGDEKTGGPADGAEGCLNPGGDPVDHVVIVSSARGAGRRKKEPRSGRTLRRFV